MSNCPMSNCPVQISYRDGIEVLEPADLREKMKQLIAKTLKRY